MDIDEKLRSALHGRVDAVQPRDEALSSIQRGVERRARRQRVARVISATVAAFAIGIGAFVGLQAVFRPASEERIGGTASPPATIGPHVSATVPVGPFPAAVAVGEGSVWATVQGNDQCDGRIVRIDPATNDVVASLPVDGYPNQIAASAGAVWVQGSFCDGQRASKAALLRIDPSTNAILATIPLGLDHSADVTVDDSGVWVTGKTQGEWSGEVIHIDFATNEVLNRISFTGDPRDVVASDGKVWVLNITKPGESASSTGMEVLHIDTQTGEVGGSLLNAWALGAGEAAVWIASPTGLLRAGPETNWSTIEAEIVRGEFVGFAGDHGTIGTMPVGGGGVWSWRIEREGKIHIVQRLNTRTMQIDATLSLREEPAMIDAALDPAAEVLWIANYRETVTRIDLIETSQSDTGAATFRAVRGWNTVNTTLSSGQEALPVSWAANVPFVSESDPSGFPTKTIRILQPDGIVMTAIGPRPYTGGENLPPLRQPLDLSQGVCSHDNYEGQPADNVSKCRIDTMVGDELLNLTVWFGSNRPTDAMVAEANEELGRLIVPSA
jgi:hypothetical protein